MGIYLCYDRLSSSSLAKNWQSLVASLENSLSTIKALQDAQKTQKSHSEETTGAEDSITQELRTTLAEKQDKLRAAIRKGKSIEAEKKKLEKNIESLVAAQVR